MCQFYTNTYQLSIQYYLHADYCISHQCHQDQNSGILCQGECISMATIALDYNTKHTLLSLKVLEP